MFIVFWTIDRGRIPNTDHYEICESEPEARERFELIKTKALVYCAGYAPIKAGTEPHWVDESEGK